MATKPNTNLALLKAIGELSTKLATVEDSIKLLIEWRNDAALKINTTRDEIDRRSNNAAQRLDAIEQRERTTEKMVMRCDTAVNMLHESLHNHEQRLRTHQSLLCRLTEPSIKARYSLPREQHVVMYGNPVDGFRIVGPFGDRDEAVRYGETEPSQNDWWIAELDTPAEQEG